MSDDTIDLDNLSNVDIGRIKLFMVSLADVTIGIEYAAIQACLPGFVQRNPTCRAPITRAIEAITRILADTPTLPLATGESRASDLH